MAAAVIGFVEDSLVVVRKHGRLLRGAIKGGLYLQLFVEGIGFPFFVNILKFLQVFSADLPLIIFWTRFLVCFGTLHQQRRFDSRRVHEGIKRCQSREIIDVDEEGPRHYVGHTELLF